MSSCSSDLSVLLDDIEKHWRGYKLDSVSLVDKIYIQTLDNLFYIAELRRNLSVMKGVYDSKADRLRAEQIEELAGG